MSFHSSSSSVGEKPRDPNSRRRVSTKSVRGIVAGIVIPKD